MEITSSKKLWNLDGSSNIDDLEKRRKKILRSNLINSLNRINFKNGEVVFKFKHKKYNNYIILKARPQRCDDTFLECLWAEPDRMKSKWKQYDLEGFSFNDGLNLIEVEAKLVDYDDAGLIVKLPEYACEMKLRAVKRHPCKDVSVQISQDGSVVTGSLINFSSESFAVQYLTGASNCSSEINVESSANIVLTHKGEFIFSGQCTIIRQDKCGDESVMVFRPVKDNIRSINANAHRLDRLALSPLPNVIFQHPLIQKKMVLGLYDISARGFSVEEDKENSVLMPGLIISDLKIELVHGLFIVCKVQVLYRMPKDDVVRCGMVIVDMDIQDHIKLSSLIHKAKNQYSQIDCTNIDLDALWDFFFEAGFVYPAKYMHIAEQKDKFISIYKKLYHEHPEIARHVIYQERGAIYGHISMFRYYQKTWLLHHHAAIKSTKHKAGLVVMEHIIQYIRELHTLPSANIDYLAAYYRPENRFAKRVFGDISVAFNDLGKSSLDEFAYLYIKPSLTQPQNSNSMILCESDCEDLEIFKNWYNETSGGLLVKALDLDPESFALDEMICNEFARAGFKREKRFFSLKKEDELIAIIIVNISDVGINMSELTNCIHFFAVDQDQLNKYTYGFVVSKISQFYDNQAVPLLLYPKSIVENLGLSCEKTYTLALLNVDYMSECLERVNALIAPKKSDIFYERMVKRLNNLQG